MAVLTKSRFMARAAEVKLIIMDVDGVLTDGRIVLTSGGDEAKCFNVKDGHGMALARQSGMEIAWISGRYSEVTKIRAKELGIDNVFQGEKQKLPIVSTLSSRLQIPMENILYIGDDIIDIEAMKAVGLGVAVADACEEILQVADWVTRHKGGHGAVREVLDLVMKAKA